MAGWGRRGRGKIDFETRGAFTDNLTGNMVRRFRRPIRIVDQTPPPLTDTNTLATLKNMKDHGIDISLLFWKHRSLDEELAALPVKK